MNEEFISSSLSLKTGITAFNSSTLYESTFSAFIDELNSLHPQEFGNNVILEINASPLSIVSSMIVS